MEILITGSSGFIGFHLKNFLEKKGIRVTPYDLKDIPPDNIMDFPNLKVKMQGVDGIVHLACVSEVESAQKDPLNCVHTNVGGTVNVLEAARFYKRDDGRPWVIFASSIDVFGQVDILPVTEETPKNPINILGVSKSAGEDLCRIFSKNYGLKTRVLRFSDVYTGKNDKLDRIIPKFILRAFKNEDLVIKGTGEEIFDFLYISDAVEGIWGCIQEVERRRVLYDDFILSMGRPISLEEVAQVIIGQASSKSKIKYSKKPSYEISKFYADIEKAKDVFGFNPSVVLEEGVSLAIRRFRQEGLI